MCLQIVITTLYSIMNTIGKTYVHNVEIKKHALPITIGLSKETQFLHLYIFIDLLMQCKFCCVSLVDITKRKEPHNTHLP